VSRVKTPEKAGVGGEPEAKGEASDAPAGDDDGLGEVAAAWDGLPGAVKAGVLAMVRASK
jgi:hypothetical protein